MKTAIFYLRKRCRKPKMYATATDAANVYDAWRWAEANHGRVYLVDCETAADGRDIVRRFRSGETVAGMVSADLDERFVCIGASACRRAMAANLAVVRWEMQSPADRRFSEMRTDAACNDHVSIPAAFNEGFRHVRKSDA